MRGDGYKHSILCLFCILASAPAMSWFLGLWISVSCLLLCHATLYETIQQHHVTRPGRNAIQILGQFLVLCTLCLSVVLYCCLGLECLILLFG